MNDMVEWLHFIDWAQQTVKRGVRTGGMIFKHAPGTAAWKTVSLTAG